MTIENITTEFKVEELKDKKKFKITMLKIDEADPENLLGNLKGLRDAVVDQQKELANIDIEGKARKENTKKMMEQNIKIAKALESAEQQAKLWIEIKNKEEERKKEEKNPTKMVG